MSADGALGFGYIKLKEWSKEKENERKKKKENELSDIIFPIKLGFLL